MVEEVQGVHHYSFFDESDGRKKGEGKQQKGKTPQSKVKLGEIREVVLPPPDCGTEFTERQCRSNLKMGVSAVFIIGFFVSLTHK